MVMARTPLAAPQTLARPPSFRSLAHTRGNTRRPPRPRLPRFPHMRSSHGGTTTPINQPSNAPSAIAVRHVFPSSSSSSSSSCRHRAPSAQFVLFCSTRAFTYADTSTRPVKGAKASVKPALSDMAPWPSPPPRQSTVHGRSSSSSCLVSFRLVSVALVCSGLVCSSRGAAEHRRSIEHQLPSHKSLPVVVPCSCAASTLTAASTLAAPAPPKKNCPPLTP